MWYHISNRQNSNSMDLCVFSLIYTSYCYIFGHVCFVLSGNPDDDTYKDIIIYVYMSLWSSNQKGNETFGKYKPSAWCHFLWKIMSPWPAKIASEQFFHPFWEKSLKPIIINGKKKIKIRAHKQKKQTKPGPYLMICIWHFRWSK